MKREIEEVDKERGIRRVTFRDERYYERRIMVGTPQECWDFVPAVTWITGHYPMGPEFYRWVAEKGLSDAEAIKAAAGDRGSKVHQAISVLLNGGTVTMKDCFTNPRSLQAGGGPLASRDFIASVGGEIVVDLSSEELSDICSGLEVTDPAEMGRQFRAAVQEPSQSYGRRTD